MKYRLALFITILQFFYTSSESNGKRDLIFSQSTPYRSRSAAYFMDQNPIEIDAFSNTQILITINKLAPFKFACQTSKLKVNYPILKAFLCMKDNLNNDAKCVDVLNGGDVILDSNQFSIIYDSLRGFEASLQYKKSKNLHGYMYCILENAIDRIVSNNIEFQNIDYYKNLISTSYKINPQNQERNMKDGNIFHCGSKVSDNDQTVPGWIRPVLEDQYVWFACPIDKKETKFCYQSIWTTLKRNEQYRVFSNYSIQLFDNAFDKYDKLLIQCNRIDKKYYSSYLVKRNDEKSNVGQYPLTTFTPAINDIEIREGNTGTQAYQLTAAYMSSAVTYIWLKDNGPISTDFKSDNRSLKFPNVITKSHEGKYVLDISEKYPPRNAQFEFNVKVLSLPKIVKGFEVPNVVYVMSGRSLNLTTRLSGDDIRTSIEINDFPFSTNDKIQQKLDLQRFRKKFSYLSDMAIEISENQNESYKEIVYNVEKISGLWFKKAFSHRITFLASNNVGTTRISTLVKAIEKPRWKIQLNKFDCVDKCFSNEPHFFKCAIFSEEYVDVGLQVKYQWRINGIDIVTLFTEELRDIYFSINEESLTINKISTNNNVRDLRIIEKLQNATLSCSASILIPTKTRNGDHRFEEIYTTLNDPLSLPYSQANISITMNNVLQSGSNNLVWIICIPLIIITVITTVTVCACYFGRTGKTYDIDQNERFAGKDPEQETFDSLYFKHYNREEENDLPVLNDHVSWSDGHSARNDNGEIDLYDTENENFDEGSIIGQYANERKR